MSADDPADGSDGAVALVTGGTSGIGRETALGLAREGWTVLVHGRNADRGEAVCATVREETPGDAAFYRADFADPEDVRGLAAAVTEDRSALDAVVANAGTWQAERRLTDYRGERSDGTTAPVEFTAAVNHCSHFLLFHRLFPLLAAAEGRAVIVSSELHREQEFALDPLTGPDGPSGQPIYCLSKLANAMFAFALARRAEGTGVTANACHPGLVPSSRLARDTGSLFRLGWKAFGLAGRVIPFLGTASEREAARTQLYLTRSPEVADVSGEYFLDREVADPSDAATDVDAQDRLWEWTADAVGVDPALPDGPRT